MQALVGVARRILSGIPEMSDELQDCISEHMASVHLTIADESKRCNFESCNSSLSRCMLECNGECELDK